jgi:2-iminobutanoate/2-iminopropanoate deaminase
MFEFITLPADKLVTPAPYSHAVRAGDFLFVCGQLAEDPATGEVFRGSLAEQTTRVMENLKLILEHAGTGFDRVVMARLFLTDLRDYDAVNQVYMSYFKDNARPSRTTVGVIGLADQGDIEIDLIAYCGQQ